MWRYVIETGSLASGLKTLLDVVYAFAIAVEHIT